jgi:uncharacterized membrane protein HdeD (DUF308 family)
VSTFLLGAMAMACAVAGLIFLRHYRTTRDRLFLWFALSFFMEAVNRTAFGLSAAPQEAEPFYYGVRLLSYLLILWAIFEKNLSRRGS